ncbi:hypothetical protein QNI22_35380 [Cytophagaceae bacterium BD1B2-1]|uniref:Uncharacterized protein n=1 Tax=Xanthocytophaga agilis TaxID=3048010 RepID=A0AAE3UHZ6_9BACT|nr:hypothetical protein [Xanthocytophaga agilis]
MSALYNANETLADCGQSLCGGFWHVMNLTHSAAAEIPRRLSPWLWILYVQSSGKSNSVS